MSPRLKMLLAAVTLALALNACGSPAAGPMATGTNGGSGSTALPAQSATPATPLAIPTSPATPTLPAGQKPPRPVPDPAAVAAGAPLRATLLAQIDDYAREVAKCASAGTPVASCTATGFEAVRPRSPELATYLGWYNVIRQCSSDGKGGYIATMMFIYASPDELRDPGLLDVYVSGTPWCGQTRPEATPSATPSARPGTPNATPAARSGERPPRPVPSPAAITAGAPLRATLLAQIDEYEREIAACGSGGTPVASCSATALTALRARHGEFDDYVRWYDLTNRCLDDGKGGYIFVNTFAFIPPTPATLRDAGLLDVYVSGTPWCGLTKPAASTATPPARPGSAIPDATSTVQITEAATAKAVDRQGRPQGQASDFASGEDVCVTYAMHISTAGASINVKIYRDGVVVMAQDTTTILEREGTSYGYFLYQQATAGTYRIELFCNGEAPPSRTLTFTVR